MFEVDHMRLRLMLPAAVLATIGANLASAQTPRPIIDVHIHYSQDAWSMLPPPEAIKVLRQAGLRKAFVSSSSDDGTQMLLKAAPDLIVPVLRPYRSRGETGTWTKDASIIAHVESRLKANTYAGIGEFHAYGADADTAVMRRMVELAKERKIFLHAHSDADAVERMFKQNPEALVLWAHSGFEQVDKVRAMVTKHKTLWADVAHRTDHAPVGQARCHLEAAVRRLPRALHGRHRHLHARALALRGRARQLLAQVARRAAARPRRQHRLPQRRAPGGPDHGAMTAAVMELARRRLTDLCGADLLAYHTGSPPPCGEGSGVGVAAKRRPRGFTPPLTPPRHHAEACLRHDGRGSAYAALAAFTLALSSS